MFKYVSKLIYKLWSYVPIIFFCRGFFYVFIKLFRNYNFCVFYVYVLENIVEIWSTKFIMKSKTVERCILINFDTPMHFSRFMSCIKSYIFYFLNDYKSLKIYVTENGYLGRWIVLLDIICFCFHIPNIVTLFVSR